MPLYGAMISTRLGLSFTAHCIVPFTASDTMELIDPIVCPDWDEMIASCPGHTFFHSSNWAGVLMDSYLYKPLYFTSREGSKISATVPIMEVKSLLTGKRGVSIPFTDRCEPISVDEKHFSSILDEIMRYGIKAGWKYIELRGGASRLNGAVPYKTYVRHVLGIDCEEKLLFEGFKPATRRNIRKAVDSGVQAFVSGSITDLHTYYGLHCQTHKRHGVPPQPWSFFEAVHKNVIGKGRGFTVLATCQGRPISGAVYFYSGKKAIYKYGASDLNYQRFRAANLVMWEAIRWFSKNGFDELCFGRTDPENVGLIHFKGGWGAQEEPLYYYRYDLKRSAFVKGAREISGLGGPIFRRMPLPLLRIVGEMLYGHMG